MDKEWRGGSFFKEREREMELRGCMCGGEEMEERGEIMEKIEKERKQQPNFKVSQIS